MTDEDPPGFFTNRFVPAALGDLAMLGATLPLKRSAVWWMLSCVSFVFADEPKSAPSAKPDPLPPAAPAETFKAEQKDHWAYQPVKRPTPPEVKEPGWIKNPIDRFILQGMESVDYHHSPEADRIALIRRVTFDLTGLPPTLEQINAYLSDNRPDAYEQLVDRLLASPQFGERWAQHWLDLAHFAESNGFELDAERPDAWRYRDWVVNALNNDMPYDKFLALQLAGDEIAPGDNSALIATGFGRAGPREVVSGNLDPLVVRQSELTEVTGTVGSVFLGMTIACARCHDHKFDAVPTTDYYRLQSFFAGSKFVELPIATKEATDAYEAAKKSIEERTAPLKKLVAEIEVPYREAIAKRKHSKLTENEKAIRAIPENDRTPAQKRLAMGLETSLRIVWEEVLEEVSKNPVDFAKRDRLRREINAIESTLPRPPAHAQALADTEKNAPETYVFRRGDPHNVGVRVEPRPPGVILASLPEGAFKADAIVPLETKSGRRKALAEWLTRPDHPLTARVIVNRLWQHHFGRGIVATPSDFGVRGEAPSHPELLDWLASELVASGWQMKPVHRIMVPSATYRQASSVPSSEIVAKQRAGDPDNTLLWRMNRRRMEAESLRDAMLNASGELNLKAGGPGVLVPIEKEIEDLIFTEAEVVDIWPETPDLSEHNRRSLYVFRKRNVRYPMFDAFDAPDTQTACPERSVSTHALQALVMLNSDFAAARAKSFAGRLFREEKNDPTRRIELAYKIALARDPKPSEVEQAKRFLETQIPLLRERVKTGETLARPTFTTEASEAAESAAWVDFALAMLNRNEFLYVP